MTRHTLTAILTGAAYVIGWKSASAWWGRCASECRRGGANGAGPVSLDVPRPQTGAQQPAFWVENANAFKAEIDRRTA